MQLFLDGDGVLADFDAAATDLFGMTPYAAEAELGSKEFWRLIEDKGDFFYRMPLMPDAYELYNGVSEFDPVILTGCPSGGWSQVQKVRYYNKHFPGVPVITCSAVNKSKFCLAGDIIIDDRPGHRHHWLAKGGVWISHYNARTSLLALEAIISSKDNQNG